MRISSIVMIFILRILYKEGIMCFLDGWSKSIQSSKRQCMYKILLCKISRAMFTLTTCKHSSIKSCLPCMPSANLENQNIAKFSPSPSSIGGELAIFSADPTHPITHPPSRQSGGWVMGWVRRGVMMGKNKFALKCSTGKIKCFKTMLVFFFNGKPGHRGPTQPA